MKVVIDRFEGSFAVVELPDREMINMPRQLVPEGALEGDVIEVRINKEETKKRQVSVKELMDDLFK